MTESIVNNIGGGQQGYNQQGCNKNSINHQRYNIILQAGGKGTRLESLTRNKPKCLLPFKNLPLIFHLFKKFPNAHFHIIADYKHEVLSKYLSIFAKEYSYHITIPKESGTISGIREVVEHFSDSESFMILWCDLVLGEDFSIPKDGGSYIGISKSFECRWSYKDSTFIKEPSFEHGVAGLFIFENKKVLGDIPSSGALVPYLKKLNLPLKPLSLESSKDVGTLLSYYDANEVSLTRPFNKIEFSDNKVIKYPLDTQGKKLQENEIAWYKFVNNLGFKHIPNIYSYTPLSMKKIQGQNIFLYDCLLPSLKQEILERILYVLNSLHSLAESKEANREDIYECYITKTFSRLELVENLIPFSKDEFIKINKRYYKNIFFLKDEIIKLVRDFTPKDFYVIHGDCTFSNMLFDSFSKEVVLIDPRGYFGSSKIYGDRDYDFAKLYYSLVGNYDQFNRKKFSLDIKEREVELMIKSSGWESMEEHFFTLLPFVNKKKIRLLHALIWFSLSTYAWEDYDSICAAFYNGSIYLGDVI